MNVDKVTAAIIAASLGVIAALCTAHGINVPGDVQPLIVMAITAVAGFIAPAIVDFGAKYAGPIHALLTVAASALSFAVANLSISPNVESVIVGVLTTLTALFVPSTAHPSRLNHVS